MRCPDEKCIGTKTAVRLTRDMGNRILRKRKCYTCGKYFWTEEKFFGWTTESSKNFMKEMTSKNTDGLDIDAIRKAIEDDTYRPQFWNMETTIKGDNGVTILEPDPTFDESHKPITIRIKKEGNGNV